MPFAFLAPLFLGGLALGTLPLWIHRIRRPEREPVRFSSLMFLPPVKKETIERRRLQHLLLMLLRIMLLLLLALAFSRPYWKARADVVPAENARTHAILLDASYSMAAGGAWDAARRQARDIIESLGPDERVGVIAFGERTRTLAPLQSADNPEAGQKSAAIRAIDSATPTLEGTDYRAALQVAQQMLLADDTSRAAEGRPAIVHLISDLQAPAPGRDSSWRLPPQFELRPYTVGDPPKNNFSLSDLAVQSRDDSLRILGKIKNWGASGEAAVEARLHVDGAQAAAKTVVVKAGNAGQVAFDWPGPADDMVMGWLELADDALAADNIRYFAWSPARKRKVLLVADSRDGGTWPSAGFIQAALPEQSLLPWALTTVAQSDLKAAIGAENSPDILALADLNGLTAETAALAVDFARRGGGVWLVLNDSISPDMANQILRESAGLKSDALARDAADTRAYWLLSWIDFSHPVFQAFSGVRFNDFSFVRFQNFHRLEIAEDESAPAVLARFESGTPAIVEASAGEGSIIIWAFSLEPRDTNLPRTSRFVPLLHETLRRLGGEDRAVREWQVAQTPAPPDAGAAEWTIQLPDQSAAKWDAAMSAPLRTPGFVRWTSPTDADGAFVEPVNVNPRESDPARMTAEAFRQEFSAAVAAPTAARTSPRIDQQGAPAGFVVRKEYGPLFLTLLFALLLLECWYAPWLTRDARRKTE